MLTDLLAEHRTGVLITRLPRTHHVSRPSHRQVRRVRLPYLREYLREHSAAEA